MSASVLALVSSEGLTLDERRTFRQIIQRIAALLALGPEWDRSYPGTVTGSFTACEFGITS